MKKRPVWVAAGLCVAMSAALSGWLLVPPGREASPIEFPAPREPEEPIVTAEERDEAFRRAKVWRRVDRSTIELEANPADPSGLLSGPIVRCQYLPGRARGTTMKFDCVLADGEIVMVKYGHTGEIPAEVAASRLLTALGFGADRMHLVPVLRCYGCVRTPFYTMWLLDKVHLREVVTRSVPDNRFTDFEWAAVQRPFPGVEIETNDTKGWSWHELDRIDPSRGASRAEIDAFRLAAMLLVHWDNKTENQRLVCLPGAGSTAAKCAQPFAFIQDLGASFGPNKVDLEHWEGVPVWSDAARCLVSMRQLPYEGGTFPDATISEEGRQLLARGLAHLTDERIAALFTSARFHQFRRMAGLLDADDVSGWTRAFRAKVREIADREPCPSLSTIESQSARSSGTSPARR